MKALTSESTQHVDSNQESLATILDCLDALVYVADINTHELIFLNEFGRKHWGEFQNKRCWEVLQNNQLGPCEFCTNHLLLDEFNKPNGKIHVWEFQNTINQHWYQCRDQAVIWIDGRIVRIEIAVDITDRKQLEQELINARRQAELLADTDNLTNIYNRRAFFTLGNNLLNKKTNLYASLIMIDMDYFKQINDTHGHAGGDAALIHATSLIQKNLREGDLFARLGGEEFAILLPQIDLEQANQTAERLRLALANTPLLFNEKTIYCTASFGISYTAPFLNAEHSNTRLLDDMLSVADSQLYEAKRAGRNRIISAASPVIPLPA